MAKEYLSREGLAYFSNLIKEEIEKKVDSSSLSDYMIKDEYDSNGEGRGIVKRAVYAEEAGEAAHTEDASRADFAENAEHAETAENAVNAEHAETADRVTNAEHAETADSAERATSATEADRAQIASTADFANNSGKFDGKSSDYFEVSGAGKKYVDGLTGKNNGLAPLDASGLIDPKYLPSYVDDVVEGYYYNESFYEDSGHAKKINGESGKIYIDLDTNESYRFGGSVYVAIVSNDMVEMSEQDIIGIWES